MCSFFKKSKITIRPSVKGLERDEAEAFLEEFSQLLGHSIEITIQNNRSMWLKIERALWRTRLFMHVSLLYSPKSVKIALASYIKKGAKDKESSAELNKYLEEHAKSKSAKPRPIVLEPKGDVYDLDEIYREVNAEYFQNSLKLNITWFSTQVRTKRFATLGLFDERRALIKINRALDSLGCPRFFVAFVVYHEALHHIHPIFFDENRQKRVIHGKAFREDEKKFLRFTEAKKWQKEFFNKHYRML